MIVDKYVGTEATEGAQYPYCGKLEIRTSNSEDVTILTSFAEHCSKSGGGYKGEGITLSMILHPAGATIVVTCATKELTSRVINAVIALFAHRIEFLIESCA